MCSTITQTFLFSSLQGEIDLPILQILIFFTLGKTYYTGSSNVLTFNIYESLYVYVVLWMRKSNKLLISRLNVRLEFKDEYVLKKSEMAQVWYC